MESIPEDSTYIRERGIHKHNNSAEDACPKAERLSTEYIISKYFQCFKNVALCTEDVKDTASIYDVNSVSCSPFFVPDKLPEAFSSLNVFCRGDLAHQKEERRALLREFVGGDLPEDQFEKLGYYCRWERGRCGSELTLVGACSATQPRRNRRALEQAARPRGPPSTVLRRLAARHRSDRPGAYSRWLKYLTCRLHKPAATRTTSSTHPHPHPHPVELRFRVYTPIRARNRNMSGRSPRLYREVVLPGDAPLSALRDRVTCLNDLGLRNDRSSRPDQPRGQHCRDVFPAASIYMDGVFYDDTRRVDTASTSLSDAVRAWAALQGLGDMPVRDMTVRPGGMRVRLGHPAVLLHQGRCEHLLTLSEVRLTGAGGGGGSRGEARAVHNVLYCVICARLAARWVVSQATSIPHEPAHLCEPCFRGYCYEGTRKAFHFKAYDFRADELMPRDAEE